MDGYSQDFKDRNSTSQAMFLHLFMLAISLVTFVYFVVTFCQGKIRNKVFNKEFMSQFDKEHQEAMGMNAPVGGLPDSGCGYYADKLAYKDWYTFNNWQRAHMNFLEMWAPFIGLMFISCINMPLLAMIAGFGWCVGRILYSAGYMAGGPQGRMIGAMTSMLSFLCALVGAVWSIAIWKPSKTIEEGEFRIFPLSYEKLTYVLASKITA